MKEQTKLLLLEHAIERLRARLDGILRSHSFAKDGAVREKHASIASSQGNGLWWIWT
jgi:hypothetical protein